ncbi:MAG: GTP pyrophosphokinase family protein [Ruminococcaceae bacterium]|nr:GTP pyrophosphokinase family protein [Oscillospiraceae bacterium]
MEKELKKAFLAQVNIPEDTGKIFASYAKQFEELMMIYQCAIQEVTTKLEILSHEMSVRQQRNPIESIKYRIKKPKSIAEKLIRNGKDVSLESVSENLNDVAGVRVICSFIEDIYTVANMLTQQDDIVLLAVKDYIKNPKPNGYRSYHMIIEIPVFFSDKKQYIKVEVQIRTIAMDFWASLEHHVKYKKDIPDPEGIAARLQKCAEVISATDEEMQNIAKHIEML